MPQLPLCDPNLALWQRPPPRSPALLWCAARDISGPIIGVGDAYQLWLGCLSLGEGQCASQTHWPGSVSGGTLQTKWQGLESVPWLRCLGLYFSLSLSVRYGWLSQDLPLLEGFPGVSILESHLQRLPVNQPFSNMVLIVRTCTWCSNASACRIGRVTIPVCPSGESAIASVTTDSLAQGSAPASSRPLPTSLNLHQ